MKNRERGWMKEKSVGGGEGEEGGWQSQQKQSIIYFARRQENQWRIGE